MKAKRQQVASSDSPSSQDEFLLNEEYEDPRANKQQKTLLNYDSADSSNEDDYSN